jgi:hypothetical protein
MRVVVITPLIVTPSLASKPKPLPLPGTLTGTLLWMDDFAHVQMEMQASIESQTSMMHDLFGHFRIILMLKSCKDLSLREVPGAQV